MSHTEDCYFSIGGTFCYPTGSPESAAASASQAIRFPDLPNPWEVREVDGPHPGDSPPSVTSPVETECFMSVGGNFCYPSGSPEALAAAEAEADYLAGIAPPTYTTTTTTTVPFTIDAPATVSEPAVRIDPVPVTTEATVMVATGPPPVPDMVLPATGGSTVLVVVSLICLALGHIAQRCARRPDSKGT